MIRALDLLLATIGLIIASPVMLLVCCAGLMDTGSPLFFQRRLGRNQIIFTLVKFRTMAVHTESVASHLASRSSVTRLGAFLRKSKLDELPQLWNVIVGDMSLVGPRPNLESQFELIEERSKRNVYSVRPGITGLAQIKGIDMSTPELLAETDKKMIQRLTIGMYFELIFATLLGGGQGDAVSR
jgi:lipopolysaccharide/colanic/teichoic acid biosynthesis glycosyltransferase